MRRLTSAAFIVTIGVLAACGGGGNKAASSSSNANSTGNSSSSAAAGGGDKGAFCQQLINSKAGSLGDDPSGAGEALNALRQVTPPDEIKDEWGDYIKAFEEFAGTSSGDDAKRGQIAASHIKSITAVSQFIGQSCSSIIPSDLSDLSSFSTGG